MEEMIYVASPAEIKAGKTIYGTAIINGRAAGFKVIESQPMPEEEKPVEHPFKKFK